MKIAKATVLAVILLLLMLPNSHLDGSARNYVESLNYPRLSVKGSTSVIDSFIAINDSSLEISPSTFNVTLIPPGTGIDPYGNPYTVYVDGRYHMATRNVYAGLNTFFRFGWYDWKCTIAPIFEDDGYHIYNSCVVNIDIVSSPVNVANISAIVWSMSKMYLPVSISFQYVLHRYFEVDVPGYSIKYLIILFITDIPQIKMFAFSHALENWLNFKNVSLLIDAPIIPDVVIEAALGYSNHKLLEIAPTDGGSLFVLSSRTYKRLIWVSYPIDIPFSDVKFSYSIDLNETIYYVSKFSNSDKIYMGIMFLSALTSTIRYASITYTAPYYIDALCVAEATLDIFNLTVHVSAIELPLRVCSHVMSYKHPYNVIQHELTLAPLPGFAMGEIFLEIIYPKRWSFKCLDNGNILSLLLLEYNSSHNRLNLKLKPRRGGISVKAIFEAENAISHMEILNGMNRKQSVFTSEQKFKVSITLAEWVVNGFINVTLLDSNHLPLNMTLVSFNGSKTIVISIDPVEGTCWISALWFNSTDSGFRVRRITIISNEDISSIKVLNMLHQSIIFLHIGNLDGLLAKLFIGKRLFTVLSITGQMHISIPHKELHGEPHVTIELLATGDEEGLTISIPIIYVSAEYLDMQGKLILYSSIPMDFSKLRVLITTCKGSFITLTPPENGTIHLNGIGKILAISIYGGFNNSIVKSITFSP